MVNAYVKGYETRRNIFDLMNLDSFTAKKQKPIKMRSFRPRWCLLVFSVSLFMENKYLTIKITKAKRYNKTKRKLLFESN